MVGKPKIFLWKNGPSQVCTATLEAVGLFLHGNRKRFEACCTELLLEARSVSCFTDEAKTIRAQIAEIESAAFNAIDQTRKRSNTDIDITTRQMHKDWDAVTTRAVELKNQGWELEARAVVEERAHQITDVLHSLLLDTHNSLKEQFASGSASTENMAQHVANLLAEIKDTLKNLHDHAAYPHAHV